MSNRHEQRKSSKGRDTGHASEREGGRGTTTSADSYTDGDGRSRKATNHERAAFHHETAAHHHSQAAQHHTTGNASRAGLHADAARAHGRRASEHSEEATRADSGNDDRNREVNRHSLSQTDDREREDRSRDDDADGDRGTSDTSASGRRGGVSAQGFSARFEPSRARGGLSDAGEGDDSETPTDDDVTERPLDGGRHPEARRSESSRRHV